MRLQPASVMHFSCAGLHGIWHRLSSVKGKSDFRRTAWAETYQQKLYHFFSLLQLNFNVRHIQPASQRTQSQRWGRLPLPRPPASCSAAFRPKARLGASHEHTAVWSVWTSPTPSHPGVAQLQGSAILVEQPARLRLHILRAEKHCEGPMHSEDTAPAIRAACRMLAQAAQA